MMTAMGINHCCGAQLTLSEAAASAGVSVDAVLGALNGTRTGLGMIAADTTVARLRDEHQQLVEVLAGYHPHFKQLRNRLLRAA